MREIDSRIDNESIEKIRLDVYLAEVMKLLPRNQIKHRTTSIRVNGREAKLSKRVSFGDTISLNIEPEAHSSLEPEKIPLEIRYEDEACIVLNKSRGLVVHPAAGNETGTLVQGLLHHCAEMADTFGEIPRPGIVHRLDKDTTGIIIAAKNPHAQEFLSSQFRNRTVQKKYYAVAKGVMVSSSGDIDMSIARDSTHRKRFRTVDIGGKISRTHFRVVSHRAGYSFVALEPKTGRTHQLRVHLRSSGVPILGDPIYARSDSRFPNAPLMLHAYSISITLPGETTPRRFSAPLPEDFKSILRVIGSG